MYYFGGCLGLNSCLAAIQRSKIRKAHGIKGNIFHDVALHYCCAACAMTQEKRELAKNAQ